MKKLNGGVTAAKGFEAAGVAAGIKYKNRKDMALVYTKSPAVVAGVYTTNIVKAAPVKWDQQITSSRETVHAVVLNSGIANACTGAEGVELNEWMAHEVATGLSLEDKDVLTASTGVIGMQLVKEPMKEGIANLIATKKATLDAGTLAAEAIMTTDTISKQCAVSFDYEGTTITLGGMTKGSGMIHPNMATMLAVFTTDAVITKNALQKLLSEDVKTSFNMISVDRDTSTNDTYVVLANGEAKNPVITEDSEGYQLMKQALAEVSVTLAKKMAGDGEGATKLLEVTVLHAISKPAAIALSKSVITSPLVKTAIFGNDANWGRILCALGYSGETFDPEQVELTIQANGESLLIVSNGKSTGYSEEKATELLSAKEVTILVDMKQGDAAATAWGCDLTYDYVKINGDYRS